MRNKKGLSDIVTTLIIILLTLVALGIIWVVIRNLIDTSSSQIGTLADCPLVSLTITSTTCTPSSTTSCTVTVQRNAGGTDISGVRVVLTNAGGSATPLDDQNNIAVGTSKVYTLSGSNFVANPTKVSVAPYFGTGTSKSICSNVQEKTL